MNRRTVVVVSAVSVVSLCSIVGVAQSPDPSGGAAPAFEVASVKRTAPGAGNFSLTFRPGGHFVASGVTLRQLIGAAYADGAPLADYQLVGSDGWMNSDRFDVNAKAAGDPQPGPNGPPPQMFLMVRTLLAERFKLAVHKETRELPVYELVLARRDGKLGPRLRTSDVDCAALMAAARTRGGNGGPPPLPLPGERMPCSIQTWPGTVTGGSMRMAQLVAALARMPSVNRPVVDKTGLNGSFDLDLSFTPEQMPSANLMPPGAPPLPAIDPNGPSLFTALQEQLGLKLEPAKGPVSVVVVDHAEPPTED